MTSSPLECDEVRDDLAEFALGLLSGRERARVLDHVVSCSTCRHEVESLTAVGDRLVTLAPSSDPPTDFEARVLERYRANAAAPRRGRGRELGLVAAALVLVAGATALVVRGPHAPAPVAGHDTPLSATLAADGHALGHLWVSASVPTWIYVSLDDASWSGTVWCSVTLRDGRTLDVGAFAVHHGHGAWAARVAATGREVREARITDVAGHVIATATVST